eukprot:1719070-Amphidinium_carterae.1
MESAFNTDNEELKQTCPEHQLDMSFGYGHCQVAPFPIDHDVLNANTCSLVEKGLSTGCP